MKEMNGNPANDNERITKKNMFITKVPHSCSLMTAFVNTGTSLNETLAKRTIGMIYLEKRRCSNVSYEKMQSKWNKTCFQSK